MFKIFYLVDTNNVICFFFIVTGCFASTALHFKAFCFEPVAVGMNPLAMLLSN